MVLTEENTCVLDVFLHKGGIFLSSHRSALRRFRNIVLWVYLNSFKIHWDETSRNSVDNCSGSSLSSYLSARPNGNKAQPLFLGIYFDTKSEHFPPLLRSNRGEAYSTLRKALKRCCLWSVRRTCAGGFSGLSWTT
jgi:hypothetical protein